MSPRPTPWGTYLQVADTLRRRIASGEYAPGSRMPSESALCAEFGVARNTIRRALGALDAEGLIVTRPALGRVVRGPGQASAMAGEDCALPRYQRIARALRTKIEAGELAPGDALPSDADVVNQYGVSRNTARQAFAELEGRGLIETVHGKGRFVRRRRP